MNDVLKGERINSLYKQINKPALSDRKTRDGQISIYTPMDQKKMDRRAWMLNNLIGPSYNSQRPFDEHHPLVTGNIKGTDYDPTMPAKDLTERLVDIWNQIKGR